MSVRLSRPAAMRQPALAVLLAVVVAGCGLSTPRPSQSVLSATSGASSTASAVAAAGASEAPSPTAAPPVPSAADAIEADVEAGKIDASTGILYRLEAQFGAPGLPAQYASDQAGEDEAVFDMAVHAVGKMPADIAAQVQPFLARPTDPTSVFHGPGGTTSALPADLAVVAPPAALSGSGSGNGDVTCGTDGWASVTSASIPVTVWGECGGSLDDADLMNTLAAMESTYPDEVALMGDPIPDKGDADAGGSPNIDIYLINHCLTRDGDCNEIRVSAAAVTIPTFPFEGPEGANKSSAFILVDRTGYAGSTADLKDIVTHEMMHVLEDAHNEEGRVQNGKSYWMTEATAKWAEEAFVPEGRAKWVYPFFNDFETRTVGLTSVDNGNAYRSFAFPYYMDTADGPESIGKAWKAFEGKIGWNAFNQALDGVVSFSENFKKFAITAWNTTMPGGGTPDLITPKFQQNDPSFPTTSPPKPDKFYFRHPTAVKLSDPPVPVTEDMPPLSARYAELELGDEVQQLVVDFSGLQPDGALDVVALIHERGGSWEQKDLPAGKTTFCKVDQDIDRIMFVMDDHGYADDSEISGSWQYQAVTDPCTPGSWNVTLKNVGYGHRGGPGTYSGRGEVDCFDNNGVWHASWGNGSVPVNGLNSLDIQQSPPAYVDAITAQDTDSLDWGVQQGFDNGTVTINVEDNGKTATVTVHASDITQVIDASMTCSTIVRSTP